MTKRGAKHLLYSFFGCLLATISVCPQSSAQELLPLDSAQTSSLRLLAASPKQFPDREFDFSPPDLDDANAPWNQPQGDDPFNDFGHRDFEDLSPAEQAIFIAFAIGLMITFFAIAIVETWLVYSAVSVLPEQFQAISPGLVWLKLIPCLNIVWMFFVYINVSTSFNNFFHSRGINRGDCGQMIGLWHCIAVTAGAFLSIIPCLGACIALITGPASLVLLIIYHVNLHSFKKEAQALLQKR